MAPKFPVTVDAIRQAIVEILGPSICGFDQLTESVNSKLNTRLTEDDVLSLCDDITGVVTLNYGDVCNVQHLIRQLTFTHRVTQSEADENRLQVGVDLALLRSTVTEFFDPSETDEETDLEGTPFPLLRHDDHELVWSVTYPDDEDDEDDEDETFDVDPIHFVVGPHDWLAHKVGSLIGFRLADDNVWKVRDDCTVTTDSASSSIHDSVGKALTEIVEGENESVWLGVDLLHELFDVIDWDLFADGVPEITIRPLTELLERSGLVFNNCRIARAGTNWAKDKNRRILRQLAVMWDVPFKSVEAHAFINGGRLVSHAIRTELTGDEANNLGMTNDDLNEFRAALHVDHAARLLATHPEDSRLNDPTGELILFLNELQAGATRSDQARIDWILSRIVTDPGKQADHLRASLSADHRFTPALEDRLFAAACQRDFNEFRTALASWAEVEVDTGVRNGASNPTARQTLRFSMLQPDNAPVRVAPTPGRNDPCPCGSGKKFKQCHLGKKLEIQTSDTTLEDKPSRSGLTAAGTVEALVLNELFALLLAWFDMNQPEVLNDINALLRLRLTDEQLVGTALFILDAAAAWRTNIDEFVALTTAKGRRWSANEVVAVRQSCDRPVSVFEVHDRAVGFSLTVRDIMSGEMMVVDAPDSSRGFEIGDYLLARVVGTVAHLRFGQGAIGIAMRDRDATMTWLAEHDQRPSATLLCMWVLGRVGRFTNGSSRSLSSSGAVGRNTSGEEVKFHNVRLSVDCTPDEINRRLGEINGMRPLPEELGNGFVWTMLDGNTVIAQIYLWTEQRAAGSFAVDFDVNSTERFERVHTILLTAFPNAQVIAHTIDNPDDLGLTSTLGLEDERAVYLDSEGDEDEEPFDPDSLSDDDRERLMLAIEEQWLAANIPALGGLTPREAADDPTRRSDLIKLLRQMNGPISGPIGIGYKAQRMAEELGVDIGPELKQLPRLPGIH